MICIFWEGGFVRLLVWTILFRGTSFLTDIDWQIIILLPRWINLFMRIDTEFAHDESRILISKTRWSSLSIENRSVSTFCIGTMFATGVRFSGFLGWLAIVLGMVCTCLSFSWCLQSCPASSSCCAILIVHVIPEWDVCSEWRMSSFLLFWITILPAYRRISPFLAMLRSLQIFLNSAVVLFWVGCLCFVCAPLGGRIPRHCFVWVIPL